MKKNFILSIVMLLVQFCFAQQILNDFDSNKNSTTYFWDYNSLATFGLVVNPDATGLNPSANCVRFEKFTGSANYVGMGMDLPTPLDLTSASSLSFQIKAPKGSIVEVSFANSTIPESWLYKSIFNITTKTDNWENIIIDLSSIKDSLHMNKVEFQFDVTKPLNRAYLIDNIQIEDNTTAPFGFTDILLSETGTKIYLYCDKEIDENSLDATNFSLTGSIATSSSIALVNGDNKVIEITLNSSVEQDAVVLFNYSGTEITSIDGRRLVQFANNVLNTARKIVYQDYDGVSTGVFNFYDNNSGSKYQTVGNPLKDVNNGSEQVGQILLVEDSPEYTQINLLTYLTNSFYDFSKYQIFHFQVLNEIGTTVKFELYNTDGITWTLVDETKKHTLKSNEWEDVYFDLSAYAAYDNVNQINVLFDNKDAVKDTFYIDNIERLSYTSINPEVQSIVYDEYNNVIELTTELFIDESTVTVSDFELSDALVQVLSVFVEKNVITLKLDGTISHIANVSYAGNTIKGENGNILEPFSNIFITRLQLQLYENFEGTSLVNNWTWWDVSGTKVEKNIENPFISLDNPSNFVTKITEYSNTDPYSNIGGTLFDKIDFSKSSIFTCNFFSSKLVKVQLCLSNSDLERPWEDYKCIEVYNTKVNEWEKLTFDMSSFSSFKDLDQILFSVNNSVGNDEQVWYFDEVIGPKLLAKPPKLLSSKKVAPDNTIALYFDKPLSPEVYADNFQLRIDGQLTTITSISLKPEDNKTLLLSVANTIDDEQNITLSYTKSTQNNISSLAGGNLLTFSQITVKNVSIPSQLYNDYEGNVYGSQYSFSTNGDNYFTNEGNPSKTGLNTSTNVAHITKPNGVQYSGIGIQCLNTIDLVQNSTFSMLVYGVTGTTVVLNLISNEMNLTGDYSTAVLRFYTIKNTDTWELASFNFEEDANKTDLDILNIELRGHETDKSVYIDEIKGPKIPGVPEKDFVPISVNIKTDAMGTETRWKITSANDESVIYAENGPYFNYEALYSHTVYVPAETELAFTIYDNAGNGMFSRILGYGAYSLATTCENIRIGGAFNDVEQTLFTSPASSTQAVNFDKLYGTTGSANSDKASDIIQTCDGGYLIVGSKNTATKSDYDLYIMHTNSKGDVLWEKTIDHSVNEYANAVKELSDGTYVIVGYAEQTGAGADSWGFIAQVDLNGAILMDYVTDTMRAFNNTKLLDVAELNDGSIVACGAKNGDVYLTRINTYGSISNISTFDKPGFEVATKIQVVTDTSLLIAGFSADAGINFPNKQAYTGLISNDLNLYNTKLVFPSENNNLIQSFTSHIDTTVIVGEKNNKMFVAQLNSDGDIVWEKDYPFNIATAVSKLYDNSGYIIAGIETQYAYLMKIDNDGDSVWTQVYDRYLSLDADVSVIQTGDGGFALTTTVQNNGAEIYLIKTNEFACGNTPFEEQICVVTRSSTEKNLIAWERTPGKGTVSYNVYRETDVTDVYTKIGAVDYYAKAGVYIDNSADPDIKAYKYKISTNDMCENESSLSAAHRTMHLSVSESSQFANAFELRWDHYEGVDFGTYKLYKSPDASTPKEFDAIQYDPFISSYTDKNISANIQYCYRISAELTRECQSQLLKSDSGPFSQSLSNIAESQLITSGIEETNVGISVFPVPVKEDCTIALNEADNITVTVYNIDGKIMYQENNCSKSKILLNTSSWKSGIYTVEISGDVNAQTKFIKE